LKERKKKGKNKNSLESTSFLVWNKAWNQRINQSEFNHNKSIANFLLRFSLFVGCLDDTHNLLVFANIKCVFFFLKKKYSFLGCWIKRLVSLLVLM